MKSLRSTAKAFAAAKYGAAGLLAGSSFLPGSPTQAAETPPNIVFILADDLSWTGINCHDHKEGCDGTNCETLGCCTGVGSDPYDGFADCTCSPPSNDKGNAWDSQYYQTPNIRHLREAGVRFTRAYVCPTSRATRTGIMTGKCPLRFSYGGSKEVHSPTLADVTIAEALDQYAGDYVSAIVGKGHLNTEGNKPHPRHYDPYRQGFDYQFAGSWMSMGGNFGTRYFPGDLTLWRDYWEPRPADYGYVSDLGACRNTRTEKL